MNNWRNSWMNNHKNDKALYSIYHQQLVLQIRVHNICKYRKDCNDPQNLLSDHGKWRILPRHPLDKSDHQNTIAPLKLSVEEIIWWCFLSLDLPKLWITICNKVAAWKLHPSDWLSSESFGHRIELSSSKTILTSLRRVCLISLRLGTRRNNQK